jgi:hypothetical protein
VAEETNRIGEERERISKALLDPATTAGQYAQLYAAQQALGWADNPEAARSPYDMVMCGPVALDVSIPPATGIPAG